MAVASPEQVAGWLAEALETGNPLAPLPEGAEPADAAAGEQVAALVLDLLGLTSCGLRLIQAEGNSLAGPVLEGRLLPDGGPVALAAALHARAAPGVMAVLAEDLALADDAGALPAFSTVHPIIDVSAWRLRDRPRSPGLAAADLAGHGFIVAGRGKRGWTPGPLPVGIGAAGARRRTDRHDAAAALHAAAATARRAGGLPRGAVLVAVFGPGLAPIAGEELVAGLGTLGRVRASFA